MRFARLSLHHLLLTTPHPLYDLVMFRIFVAPITRAASAAIMFAMVLTVGRTALAGSVLGRLELPSPPPRPAAAAHGFIDAVPNLLAPVRTVDPTPWMFVMLESATPIPPGARSIELDVVGEKFSQTVMALPLNTELVIKNASKTVRFLAISEAPQLLDKRPLNPNMTASFRPLKSGDIYNIIDSEAPHLRATIVVTPSIWVAPITPDGKFELANIPEGKYAVRVFYKSGWIDKIDPDTVTVTANGKAEFRSKIPSGFPLKK
jgi:hypothetical protein